MKVNKIYKTFMFLGLGLTVPAVAVTAACSTNGNGEQKPKTQSTANTNNKSGEQNTTNKESGKQTTQPTDDKTKSVDDKTKPVDKKTDDKTKPADKKVEDKKDDKMPPVNKDEKVIFQLAQNNFFPLVQPLKDLAKIYNEQQKNTENFLPVDVQDSDKIRIFSESGLANVLSNRLAALKKEEKPSYDRIPNLIIGNQIGANLINKQQGLLNLSKTDINKNLFDNDIYRLHNGIPGAETGAISSIPFDLTTLDALVFNLDIMKLIFDQIILGGGTIDKNSEIYKRVERANAEGNTEIPKDKIWRYMVTKEGKPFTGYTVDDSTFASYTKMAAFAKKVYDNFILNDSTVPQGIKEKFGKSRDVKVLMVDSHAALFQKVLYNEAKANIGTSIFGAPEKFLWKSVTDPVTKKESIVYSYEDPKEKDRFNKILSTAFDKFVRYNSLKDLVKTDGKAVKFKSIHFSAGGTRDWASWDVRTYDAAFGIAPHVGTKQSILDSYTVDVFAKNNPTIYKDFATSKDVWWKNQVTQIDPASTKGVFFEGGSALIPITTTEQRDKATIKFLDWLFKGTFKKDGKDVFAKDFIRDQSSYIIPTKDRISYEEFKKLKANYDVHNDNLEALLGKEKKTDEDNKKILELETTTSILRGALLSLEDVLNMKGISLTTGKQDESKRIPILLIQNDEKTSKFLSRINVQLIGSTRNARRVTGKQIVDMVNK